ncbi:MAG: ATP-binding protein [Phycisphaerales bacterium]|jgi:signal transduction histidine kinase|nr:ATP-binding protein [Phycisphaerales bacterium]
MLTLEVIEGPDLGGIFPLPSEEPQLIGRSSEALPLKDPTISRRHAELTPDNGKWYLMDLASANGTFLNGRLLSDRVSLRIGDEIGCGSTLFRITEHTSVIDLPNILEDTNFDTSAESIVVTSPHSLESARNHLRMIHRLTSATAGTIDPTTILRHLVAILSDEFKPDRCVGVLLNDTGTIAKTVEATQREIMDNASIFSEAIVMHACKELCGIRIPNIKHDVRFVHDEGAVKSGVKSVICAPLLAHGKAFGAILLEIHTANRRWTDEELELLSSACGHAGLALLTAVLTRTRLQHERLAAMGETVASISHSVKNMLQGLRSGAGAIDLALGRGDIELAREGWPILARNLDRVYALTFNMLAWSRSNTTEISLVQIKPIVDDALSLVRGACDRRLISLQSNIEEDVPPIPIDQTAFLQVLLNVLNNSIEASPSKSGVVDISVSIPPSGEIVEIVITDNGCGIEDGERETVFRAFHSTKGQRGTGLGLAVARKVVLEHQGSIELIEADSGGTCCRITLPLSREGDPGDTHGPKPV